MFESIPNLNSPADPGQPKESGTSMAQSPAESPEEFISVMPSRFKSGRAKRSQVAEATSPEIAAAKKKKSKLLFIGVIVLVVIIVFGGLAGFYFWAKHYLQAPKNPLANQASAPAAAPSESAALNLSVDLLDPAIQQKLATAQLSFPAGALEPEEAGKVFELVTFAPSADSISDLTYQYLGGAYKIQPEAPVLKRPATLTITYVASLVNSSWEPDLKIGYLQNGAWTTLNGQLDVTNKTMTVTLDTMPSDTYALLIEASKNKNQETQIAPQIFSSPDQDNDGLTDTEEKLYQTDPANSDTDADGQTDGQEVVNLFDPLHTNSTLILSGLVKVFTNDQQGYSIFYPSNWLVKPLPETDSGQVMVVTNTGEFFEVSAQDNFDRLSPKDWYLKEATGANPAEITETTVAGQPAVWNPDHLNLYVGLDNKIYILTYNLGTEQEANLKTTFKMMIKSFQFLNQESQEESMPEGKYRGNRPDGTLIKYANSPAIYLLENTKRRPIKSEAALTRLGYNFSQVITIPDAEWYPDGQPIE